MGYLKERVKHVFRFRHKRGFGVHSPFMFNLILNVIRDKGKRFVYPPDLESSGKLTARDKKVFRLLSRLVRYLEVRRITSFASNAVELAEYLSYVYKDAIIRTNTSEILPDSDFIYVGRGAQAFVNETALQYLFSNSMHKRCIVIADIHKKNFNGRLWLGMKERSTVSVDMMWYGILFFDNKIQSGEYKLVI